MIQKTILIIEDDPDLRDTIALALQAEGYSTLVACNGRQGLDLLLGRKENEGPISCIILDLMMPEMDGQEFLRILHSSHPEMAKIPILVATAVGTNVQALKIPYGVQRIQKPMELEELYTAVRDRCFKSESGLAR